MDNEIIRKYIASVTRSLPRGMRRDVAQELDSLISDMLEKRCGGVLPADRDIKVVLAELGEPWELAAKYSPNPRVLIGSRFYRAYMGVLLITVITMALGVTSSWVLELFASGGAAWYLTLAYWFGNLLLGFWISFGVVTFLFAVTERAVQRYEKKNRH